MDIIKKTILGFISIEFVQKHKYVLMIATVLITASVLVIIAMNLYNSSGTAQIDLSRPGYQSVREKSRSAGNDDEAFPSVGRLDKDAIEKFRTLYDARSKRVTTVDGFKNDVLSDESLSIYAEPIPEQE